MTNEEIKQQRKKILKSISSFYDKLKKLQIECPHDDITKEYGSNTGNYDPNDDCYWEDHTCNICGKEWTIWK